MTIYRGPGGTGEAHTDNDVTEVRIVAAEAEGYRDEAAISAANALESANNAAFSASEAATSAAIAEQAVIDTSAAVDAAEASAASALDSKNAAHGYADAALVSKNAAAASASNAATSETNAATSEANALASENAAALSEANAATSETNAATSETNAAASAAAALISENNAASSETNAAASESAAAASASSAASSWDQFDDRYLGAKASDPTVDNDGNALLTGALYWNTTTNEIKIWNGTGWAFFSGLPSQVGNSGKYLSTNGSVPAWSVVPDPQPATPTNDGLVFGDTPTAVPSTSGGWNGSDANLIFDGTFKGGTYAYGAWTSFVDSTVHVGDHIYVTRLGTELYYGVVTGIGTISGPGLIWRYFSVSNPLNQPSFTASSCAIRSPFIAEGGNVSLGYNSGSVGSKNTSIGYGAGSTITTGTNLTVVGYDSEPSSATATNEATLGNSSTTKTRLWGAIAVNDQTGTTGQVLTSNGSGTATWQTLAAAGVLSVTGTAPIASSGGATPAISLNAGYGDTQNPFASKTANFVLAAPNGSAGAPTFRAIVAADIPTLNQNTTGTSSNVTGTVAIANGGTGATTAPNAATNLGLGTGNSPSFTGLTLSGGTANGIPYLNASKVLTSGSALTFDGTNLNATASVISGGIGLLYGNTYSAGNSQAWLTVNSTASDTYRVADTAMRYRLLTGVGHTWETAASGAAGGAITWAEQMRLTSTGLGIGTSSPDQKVHAYNTASNTWFRAQSGGDNSVGLYMTNSQRSWLWGVSGGGAGAMYLYDLTGSKEVLNISASGNLGLGVTPSAWVTGKAFEFGATGNALWGYAGNTVLSQNTAGYSTNFLYATAAAATRYQQTGGQHQWYTAPSGAAGNAITFTRAMTLDVNGQLFLGRTTAGDASSALTASINGAGPYTTFFSNESTSTSAYNVSRWLQGAAGSAVGYVGTGGSAVGNAAFANSFVVGTQTSNPLVFATVDVERARIDSSGNLLVGTTSAGSQGQRLATDKSGGGNYFAFGSNNSNAFVVYNSSNTGVYLVNGQTAWTANSDERLKDIIEPITDAVAKVSTLRTVIGKYKTDAEGTRRAFLIAQDVQAVLPEAVNTQADEQGTLGVQYTDTIPLLVAAIKEQQAIINQLKARLDAANL